MNSGSLNPPRCRMACANPTKKNWALGSDPVAPPGAPPHISKGNQIGSGQGEAPDPSTSWHGSRGPGSLGRQVVQSGVLWPLSCSQGQKAWKVDSLLLKPNGWSGGTCQQGSAQPPQEPFSCGRQPIPLGTAQFDDGQKKN